MPNKKIPVRRTASAEEYAQKVRMEPPKASRQEEPLVAKGKVTARQHNMKKSRISPPQPVLTLYSICTRCTMRPEERCRRHFHILAIAKEKDL
jgi:hypothetical protein